MHRPTILGGLVLALVSASAPAPARADDVPPEVQNCIDKGLKWLAAQQAEDGHWSARHEAYPTAMTAMAGMALLMEGSTLREGKYRENIRRAVTYLLSRSQSNGLIGNPDHFAEAQRYTYGHGYALLFLASAYGEEENAKRRKKIEEVLVGAVKFSINAQTERGGWGYVSAADGDGFDEGSTTITQLQGLRAARDAGIPVTKEVIDKAKKYLKDSTLQDGSLYYNLANENGRIGTPALSAAAVAGSFSAGEYDSPLAKKWLRYCRVTIEVPPDGALPHEDYTHYYYAQSIYILGEKGYARMFPDVPEGSRLTWSKYRNALYHHLTHNQDDDGKWDSNNRGQQIGPVFATSINLAILQLDKGALPIYQR